MVEEVEGVQGELSRCSRSIDLLYQTLLEITAEQSLDALLQAIVHRVAELVGTKIAAIMLLRPDGETMELAAGHNIPAELTGQIHSAYEGINGAVIQTGEPLVVEDYSTWDGRVFPYDHLSVGRALAVPLRMGGRVIGSLSVADVDRHGPFSMEETRLTTMFAEQAAIALHNARLYESARQQIAAQTAQLEATNRALRADIVAREQAATLLRLQRDLAVALSEASDLDEALNCSLHCALHIEGLDAGGIYLIDLATGALELKAYRHLPEWFVEPIRHLKAEAVRGHPLFQDKPVYLEDGKSLPFSGELIRRAGFRVIAAVPVRHEGRSIAVISLASKSFDRIPETSRHALESVAAQIGSALARLRAVAEREETVRALAASEARYRAIIEDQTELICRFKADGTLTFVNESYCHYFGKKADELIGHKFYPLIPPEDQQVVQRALLVAESGCPVVEAEHRVIKDDGSIRWQEWSNRGIFDEAGNLIEIQAVGRDVTERKRLEAERDEQRRMLQAMLAVTPDIVVFKDRNSTFQLVSERLRQLIAPHLRPEEMIGRNDFDFFPEELAKRFLAEEVEVLTTGKTLVAEHRLPTCESERWFESVKTPLRDGEGEIIGLLVSERDITDRRKAEMERDEQRQMLRALLDHLPHHILFKDRNLVYRVINQSYCDFFGRSMDEMLGITDLDVWPREDALRYMEGERQLLETGEPIRIEKFTQTRWGPNWREAIKNPLRDDTGKIIGILVAAHDITALKLADERLRRRNEELAALNIVTTAINQYLDLECILSVALKEILNLDMIGSEGRGEIFLLNREGNPTLYAHQGIPQSYLDEAKMRGQYLCDMVCQRGRVIISDDEVSEEGDMYGADSVPHRNLALPLRSHGRVLGCINLWLPVDKALSEDEFLFLGAISDQVSVAIENAYLYEDLRLQNLRVRALSQQLVENAENERRQVAQDLHDMVGQYLTALGINLNILKQKWATSAPDKVMTRLEECAQLVERTADYIRGLMAHLRPPVLDDYGLFPALGWLGEQFARRMDLQVDVIGCPLSSRLDPHVEITLFRIVQEALTNVVKHANASRAEVSLTESDGRITLQVKDDGVGFDPNQASRPSERGGWGLFAIREWTEALGGCFEVQSAPGEGTTLRVIWQRY